LPGKTTDGLETEELMATSALHDEKFPSMVAAAFATAEQARDAADQLVRETGIGGGQVSIVEPDDPGIDRKLEPETGGIRGTLIKSHLTLGFTGLIVGMLIGLVLVLTGYPVFISNPWYTFGILAGFGAIGGLLLGGLISLRPDHYPLLAWVKDTAPKGRWFVLVHARDHGEESRARDLLKGRSDKVMATF
jgi:hypothetical protein